MLNFRYKIIERNAQQFIRMRCPNEILFIFLYLKFKVLRIELINVINV